MKTHAVSNRGGVEVLEAMLHPGCVPQADADPVRSIWGSGPPGTPFFFFHSFPPCSLVCFSPSVAKNGEDKIWKTNFKF